MNIEVYKIFYRGVFMNLSKIKIIILTIFLLCQICFAVDKQSEYSLLTETFEIIPKFLGTDITNGFKNIK